MTLTPDFTVKRDDVGRTLSGQFKNADGTAVDCTGFSSTKLFWTDLFTDVVKINGATFTINPASTGVWSYALTADNLNTSRWYKMEFQVYFGTNRIAFPTDPDKPFYLVLVQDDMG